MKQKPRLKDGDKLPSQTIEVDYKSEQGPIRRTIFIYEGEDPNVYLSKAWKPEAVRAEIFQVIAKLATRLKPSPIEGEWDVTT